MNPQAAIIKSAPVDKYTAVALFIGLIAYPLLYSTDFFGSLLFSVLPDGSLNALLDESSRAEWWYFLFSNIAFHWIPFFCIWFALAKNGEKWLSVGVDWHWFSQRKTILLSLLVMLIIAALVMPTVYYDGELPAKSKAGFIGPISSLERLFIILLAFTAAVTEEVIFRGYALTRLSRWIDNSRFADDRVNSGRFSAGLFSSRRINSAWLVLPITVIAFVFIHGEMRSWGQSLNFIIAGFVFAIPFILMKLKRLELVILIHFLIDASLVFIP